MEAPLFIQMMDILDILPNVLAERFGSSLSSTRLFSTMLYIYPIAVVQRLLLQGQSRWCYHLYYTITSFILLVFNFGWSSYHFFTNIILFYTLLIVVTDRKQMLVLSGLLNMGYLTVGYLSERNRAGSGYEVTWTTPHCVLTLKLIGLSWDIYDKSLSKELKSPLPSLLEVCGFSCFTPAFLTGPQISFTKYTQLVSGNFDTFFKAGGSWSYGLLRLATGIALTATYPILYGYIPESYMVTEEFKDRMLIYRICYMALWGLVILQRYIGVWIIAEGSCIFSGIAYNGTDVQGTPCWDGSANVKLQRFYTGTRSQHYIEGFNINTNKWVLTYVYKRLKFLNNKMMSQAASLLFLAVWHGFYTGYFFCFFMELIIMNGEADIKHLFTTKRILSDVIRIPGLSIIIPLFCKLMSTFTLAYSLACFELLESNVWLPVIAGVHYLPTIFYLCWPLVYQVLRFLPDTDAVKQAKLKVKSG